MIRISKKLLLLAVVFVLSNTTFATELIIPIAQQGEDLKGVMPVPNQGDALTSLQSRWGQPITQSTAPGEPPISKLEYADFFVYLEHDKVLHTVIKPK